MTGSLLGCDAMSVGTWHDMASHLKILKSAAILLSQPPLSYVYIVWWQDKKSGW